MKGFMISIEHVFDDSFNITSIYINLIKKDELKYFNSNTKEISADDEDCIVNLDFGKRIFEIYKNENEQITELIGVEIILYDADLCPSKVLDKIQDHISADEFNKVMNIVTSKISV